MSKIKIEDEYEINDELVFFYPNAEVGMIHSHVLDVLYYDNELIPHLHAIEDLLLSQGVVFTSPGGSFKRKLLYLLKVLMNKDERKLSQRRSRTLSLIPDRIKEKMTSEQIQNFLLKGEPFILKMLRQKEMRMHLDPIAQKIISHFNLVN